MKIKICCKNMRILNNRFNGKMMVIPTMGICPFCGKKIKVEE